jgi:hypothetical protein
MAMQVATWRVMAGGLERDRKEREEMRVLQAANSADKPQQLSWIVSVQCQPHLSSTFCRTFHSEKKKKSAKQTFRLLLLKGTSAALFDFAEVAFSDVKIMLLRKTKTAIGG